MSRRQKHRLSNDKRLYIRDEWKGVAVDLGTFKKKGKRGGQDEDLKKKKKLGRIN